MKNDTLNFINIINLVVEKNKEYLSSLEEIKTNDIQKFTILCSTCTRKNL